MKARSALGSRLGLVAACGYLLGLLCYRVAEFPGIHGDEAWMGLFALRMRDGLPSPHGMNTYTGSLFGWLISRSFAWLGPGHFALRLPGVLANAAAALLLAGQLARRVSLAAAWCWVFLAGTSAMFLLHARVAWEVYALQPLLLSALLVLSRDFLESRRYGLARVLLFLAACHAGMINHFIFASVPLSLAAASWAHLFLYRDREHAAFFRLCAISLAQAVVVYLLKPGITDAFWLAHRPWLLAAAAALPALSAAAFAALGERADAALLRWLDSGPDGRPAARRWFRRVLLAGFAAFCTWHLAPMVQIWSGTLILKRMASWELPWPLSLPMHLWAAFLLAAYLRFAFRALETGQMTRLPAYERFLVYWPLAYMCVFILIRHTSSIRYYILPSFLFMAGTATALARLPWTRGPRFLVPAGLFALTLHGLLWSELRAPQERRPIKFKVGWRKEYSRDFQRKHALYEVMREEQVCRMRENDSFIGIPLIFHHHALRFPCDPDKVLDAKYCPDCAEPPYFTWSIARASEP